MTKTKMTGQIQQARTRQTHKYEGPVKSKKRRFELNRIAERIALWQKKQD